MAEDKIIKQILPKWSDTPLQVRVSPDKTDEEVIQSLEDMGYHPRYTPLPGHVSSRGQVPSDEWTITDKVWNAIEAIDIPRAGVVSFTHALSETGDVDFAFKMAKRGYENNEHPVVGDWIMDVFDSFKDGTLTKEQAQLAADIATQNPPRSGKIEPWLYTNYTALQSALLAHTPEGKAATATVGGLAGDVAMDPITWANPMAGLVKAAVMGTPARRVVESIAPRLEEALAKAKDSELVKPIRKLFDTSLGQEAFQAIPEMQDSVRRIRDITIMAREQAIKDNALVKKTINQEARKMGIPVKDVERFVTEMVEKKDMQVFHLRGMDADTVAELMSNPQLRNVAAGLQNKNIEQLKKEMSLGLRISEYGSFDKKTIDDFADRIRKAKAVDEAGANQGSTYVLSPKGRKMRIENAEGQLAKMQDDYRILERQQYFKHAISPQFQKYLKKERPKRQRGGSSFEFSGFNPSSLARKWRGMTIDQINTKARLGELPGYEGQKFDYDIFQTDPAVVQALRDMNHAKSVAVGDTMADIKYQFGEPVENGAELDALRARGDEFADYVTVRNPLGKGYAFPKEVAALVDKYYDVMMDPGSKNAYLKAVDSATNWWKAWTLSPFPSYHARNMAGNAFNNYVVGVNPGAYGDVVKMFEATDLTKGGIKGADGNLITWKQIKDMAESNELGIRGRGLMGVDIEQGLKAELGEDKWLSLGTDNKIIRYGKKAGEAMENYFRYANFIDGLKKGLSPQEAAHRVRQTLFDYADITEFEQNVAKRLMPFYTWSRKNIPFQLANMVRHPGKYKAVDSLRREIEARQPDMGTDEKWLSDMFLENYPTRIGFDKHGNPSYFLLGTWLPAGDVIRAMSAPQNLIRDNLHPAIKIGLETFWAGEDGKFQNLFTDQVLAERVLGETQEITDDFLGFKDVPRRLSNIAKNIRLFSELDGLYYGMNPDKRTPSIYPELTEPRNGAEAMVGFLTGLKRLNANPQFEKQQYAQRLNLAEQDIQSHIKRQLGAGVSDRPEYIRRKAKEFSVRVEDLMKRLQD